MAADDERPIERKLTDRGVKKLLPGEKVEVLYSEEGLKGSWHIGMVIDCGNFSRSVELANLLNEKNSSKLVDSIPVSAAIDGLRRNASRLHRNRIRPLPPTYKIKEAEIRYGLCVDAFVDDAWWEGVVFDHHEGSSERLIFFPDQGDQQAVSFQKLRLTQEWNEASGLWKQRGEWVFLQVIQYFEQEGPLPVSVREIWYDLRSTTSFLGTIGLWISGSKSIWYELVAKLLQELNSIVNDLPFEVSIPNSELCENNGNGICFHDWPEVHASSEQFLFLSSGNETNNIHHPTSPNLNECSYCFNRASLDGMHCDSLGKVHDGCEEIAQTKCLNCGFVCDNLAVQRQWDEAKKSVSGIPPLERSETWRPIEFKAKKCDEAISLYLDDLKDENFMPKSSKSRQNKLSSLRLKAKRHLVYLGWIIKTKRVRGHSRFRFESPNGQCYNTLRRACFGFLGRQQEKNRKQPCNNLHSLDGFHFVSSSYELLSMNSMSETNYSPHDDALNVLMPVENKNLFEVSNQIIDLNVSSEDTKKSSICKRKYRSGMKKSNAISNSVMNEKSGCEFTEERHGNADCFSDKKGLASVVPKQVFSMYEDIEPGDFPGAVSLYIDYWYSRGVAAKKQSVGNAKILELNAKKHLLFLGWKFLKTNSGLFYVSPSGKVFRSLYSACKTYLEEENSEVGTSRSLLNEKIRRRLEYLSREMKPKKLSRRVCRFTNKMADESFHEAFQVLHNAVENRSPDSSKIAKSAACSILQIPSKECRESKKRKITSACQSLGHKLMRHSANCSSACAKSEKRKTLPAVNKRHSLTCRVRRSSKRSREVDALASSPHASRTVLSLLIENDVVLPRQKVMYIHKTDGHIMMEGRITREGIKCKCCSKVHTLSTFEAHAGSTLRRPAANIHLKDGRSLLQCQNQMLGSKIPKGVRRSRLKGDCSIYQSDSICSVCHDGGSLILCDHCPSSFHLDCVGLKNVPEANWFCASCLCHICGMSEFNPDTEQFTDKTVLHCDQCEQEYHVGCVRERECKSLQSCPPGNWFCSKICSKIFLDIRKLVGIPKPASVEGLSCTILRSGRDYRADCDLFDSEIMTEHHSKLFVALKVLHECFVTMIEPRTQSDLVGDILFNKESELKRLNFYGFYTMLLEKGDELVSVATFRIYGEKIAEMPLVGTRVQYRRQGMCRLLIRELEQLLISIGVERFVLPAVPQLLETWTSSFGFSKMSNTERLNILNYSVLNFEGTTLCQKILSVPPSVPQVPCTIPRDNFDISRLADHELILALPCFGANSSLTVATNGTTYEPTSHQSFLSHTIPTSRFIKNPEQTAWNEMKQTV